MRRGLRASGVALIGVIVPFVLGTYVVGPLLLPGLSPGAYLFIGAALTATSIGITGRVFRDMGYLGRPEAQIVLGAAVIDDVLGLLILAVVSSIATRGMVSAGDVAAISLLAVGFLLGAVLGGHALASQGAGRGVNRWIIGWGMVPRGEVGLIFAFVGKSLGIVNDAAFSVIVVMVMLTTLVTPPMLAYLLRGTRAAPERVPRDATADPAH